MEIYDDATRISCLIISFIYYLIGTIGNSLIIWTILRLRYLRSIQNVIVAILAVTDLLIVDYLLPLHMQVLISNDEPEFEHCRIHALATTFLFTLSLQLIMIISVSRYVKICHSPKYNVIFTAKNLTIIMLLFCVIDVLFSSLLWLNDDWWIFDKQVHSCVYNRYNSSNVSMIVMAANLGIPFAVTIFCYFQIYRHVIKARKNLHNHWNNGLIRRKLNYENMVTRTQFAVFASYLVLFIPAASLSYGQRSDFPEAFHTVSFYLCYLSSCINSFLYGFLNKDMRKGYRESLSCLKHIRTQRNKVVPTISGPVRPTNVSCTTEL